MKYIISGGGTGGHIYPALSILDEIKKHDKEGEFLYVGRPEGLEKDLAEKAGYEYKSVRIKGLPRRINLDSVKTGVVLLEGLADARKILKSFKPDVVIGTGGYVCFPIVFLAQKFGIKTFLQESNAFPGKVNRILSKKADGVFISFEDAKKRFTNKENLILTGNPIRDVFTNMNKEDSRRELGISPDKKFILSFGGSGGQESINNALIEIFKNYQDEYKYKHIHITGKDHYDEFINTIKNENINLGENIDILDYSHNIPELLSAADVAILSSSAISLAEVSAVGAASILIPKEYTADNHQEFNARSFQNQGASEMILEKDLTGELLYSTIISIVEDESKMQNMEKCAKMLSMPNSTKNIVENIIRLSKWINE